MINNKQKRAVELLFEGNMTQKEIAAELNVSQQTMIKWKKQDKFKAAMEEYERERLKGLAPLAIKTMKSLLTAKSEFVRFQAANDILDRTGHKPTDKQDINVSLPQFVEDVPDDD